MRHPTDTLAIANVYALLTASGGSVTPIVIALGGLTGSFLLGDDKSLATLPVAGFNIGVALMASPAAILMFWIGRKYGFMIGAGLGFVGVSLAGYAITVSSFTLFLFSLILIGCANSFSQQYRFAASDYVDSNLKSKAISRVLIGGIAAAILGPQIVMHFKDILYPTPFAGAFIVGSLFYLISFLLMYQLPNQPLERSTKNRTTGRSRGAIAIQPKFIVAVLCGACSYAMMAFVMTAAPLAMVGHDFQVSEAALGIQWHILAMYVPSLITGSLITRFGKICIISWGMTSLIASALVALNGITLGHFHLSLVLLGLGWNFGFIGSTALLTEAYTTDEKHKAQGLNDTIVFSAVGLCSLSSGLAYHWIGWEFMNWLVIPAGLICLGGLFFLSKQPPNFRLQ
ncbi:MFS transporter [Litorivicinus sp.]|nr:MFS transporter [Litorivicinus sp.]MDC1239439.1 MFS transporter [Litorivicinus sp.]